MNFLLDLARTSIDMGITIAIVLCGFWVMGNEVTFNSMAFQSVVCVALAVVLALLWLAITGVIALYQRRKTQNP